MNVEIIPALLEGEVDIPSSKSASHRMLICAALAKGESRLTGITLSKDIEVTINALRTMGASIYEEGDAVLVRGIASPAEEGMLDCGESGSTLRFLIPVAAALGMKATFTGKGKLPERPITPYVREFPSKGISLEYQNTMPFTLSGKLCPGEYRLEGDISSQFISGLLFALPLCSGESFIRLTSPLQSKPYADMTLDALKNFGVEVFEEAEGYRIPGNQTFRPCDCKIEGDYSQAAFFYVANALGCSVHPKNLNPSSVQGDKKILEIIRDMGYTENTKSVLSSFHADVGDIPDLVPILAVLACFGREVSHITNAARLRIKESDRLTAIAACLNRVGGKVEAYDDRLVIHPVEKLTGGTVESFNDHRIVMAMAMASVKSEKAILIKDAGAVTKSYPGFFDDFNRLGGNAHVIHVEP